MSEIDPGPVVQLLARERLALDDTSHGRTAFFSHLGASPRLRPGPWIGHRDLLYALALANLAPTQRESLARAVLVEHGRDFGVGRLRLRTAPSGLPLGGSLLWIEPRDAGPRILYAWAVGPKAQAVAADWLLLRAHPAFGLDEPPPVLDAAPLATAAALGDVLVAVDTAVTARLVADHLRGRVPLAAHPRFAPHLDGLDADASVVLWPHDALGSRGLRRRKLLAVLLVDAPEYVRAAAETWVRGLSPMPDMAAVTAPGIVDRDGLVAFVDACDRPAVCLRGDPAIVSGANAFLQDAGFRTAPSGEAHQLRLL